ncbi:MAG: hypothetical protein ACRETW_10780 [Stenotrophobium sp.]
MSNRVAMNQGLLPARGRASRSRIAAITPMWPVAQVEIVTRVMMAVSASSVMPVFMLRSIPGIHPQGAHRALRVKL